MITIPMQNVVKRYVSSVDGAFSSLELFEEILIADDESICERVQNYCISNKELNLIHYIDSSGFDMFIKREHLLEGAKFCIKPTPQEVDENILFAGHRFMPFCNPVVTPGNIIFQDVNNMVINRKDYETSILEAGIYHSLFGRLGMIGTYTFDNEQNIKIIEEHGFDSVITLPVFDMKAFYAENNFKNDDLIVVEVINWKSGIVKVKAVKHAVELQSNFAEITDWIENFNETLNTVCNDFGPATNAEQQLERVFAINSKLLKNPVVHIGGAIQLGHKLAIQDVGGNCVIWDKNEDPEECLSLTEYSDDIYDHSHELPIDQLMIALGIPYSSTEVEAFIRHDFYNKIEGGVDLFYLKYFELFEDDLNSENCNIIKDFISEKYESIKSTYNVFADNNTGVLRSKLINVKLKMVDWLVAVETAALDIDELPTKKVLQFTEIMSYITQSLAMCNNTESILTKKELDISVSRLEELEEHVLYLMKDIASL